VDEGSYWMTFMTRQDTVIRTGSTRSHSVENSLWKRLLTCCKADCGAGEGTQVSHRFRKGVYTHLHSTMFFTRG